MNDTPRPAWPYLVFTEQLRNDLERHHDERQLFDHGRGTTGPVIGDVIADTRQRMGRSEEIVARLSTVLTPSRVSAAFGDGTLPGDEGRLRALASDIVIIYADLLTWGRTTQGCQVPDKFKLIYRALANLVRSPLNAIEEFVADASERAQTLDQQLSAGVTPTVDFSLTLKLTIDDLDLAALNQALAQAMPRKHWFSRR
jgi:hypothetical protein